jgi:tetratricopeptide (TPR) repeat protein
VRVRIRLSVLSLLLVASISMFAQQQPQISARPAPPSPTQKHTQEAMNAYRAHDYKRALEISQELTKEDPRNPLGYNLEANSRLEMNDYPGAIKAFQKALELEPNAPHDLAGLVRAYAQSGQTKERDAALQRLREVVKSGKVPKDFWYIFDVFHAGADTVVAAEYPPLGTSRPRYQFNVYDASKKVVRRLQLEPGEPSQKRHGGQFALAGYASSTSNQASVYKLYPSEPKYEAVRTDVEKVLSGELKPVTRESMR